MKKANSSRPRKVREATSKYRVEARKGADMALIEEIQKRLVKLSPERQREVLDFVTFLQAHSRNLPEPATDVKRSEQIKVFLTQLAKMQVFSDITDPVDWQRKVRKDRSLPGRAA